MLRDEVHYRTATILDAAELAAFGAQAFMDAFGDLLPATNLSLHVLRTYSRELQAEELNCPGAWALVGDRDGDIVGAALMQHSPIPFDSTSRVAWVEVRRFYLGRIYWHTGLSADLMAAALSSIRGRGGEAAWITVWEGAEPAIRFFRKWGFQEAGRAASSMGAPPSQALVLARSLRPHGSQVLQ